MFRIDFGRCMLENIKELLLFMLLRAWARACIRSLDSCVRSFVLAYAGMFLRFYIRRDGPAYARSYLCTWALTRIHETSGRSPTLPIFTFFHLFHFCMQS